MGNQMIFKRYELKYLMTKSQQEAFLRTMEGLMIPDRFSHSSIRNLYFDTPTFRLIRDSLDRPVYKEKLRLRSYGRVSDQDTVFAELKKKYESIIYKRRITLPLSDAQMGLLGYAPLPDCQVGREIDAFLAFYSGLTPKVFLSYERDSYCSADGSELRVTFDDSILYRTEDLTLNSEAWGIPLLEEDDVLMEVKLPESMPMWMARSLSAMGIQKTSFSKYGAAYQDMMRGETKGALQYA